MLQLSDQDLLARLRTFEDHFVERKLFSDKRDWLRTTVAFANSCPIGYPAVLFIGVRDDGTTERKSENVDAVQKSFMQVISTAYPPIPAFPRVLSEGESQFLAVLIPGSPDRPHFAGPSYVRVGAETRKASEEQFAELITQRTSKAREILAWKGREVTVDVLNVEETRRYGRIAWSKPRMVIECTQYWVTLQYDTNIESIPLGRVELSYDHSGNRLKLEVRPW